MIKNEIMIIEDNDTMRLGITESLRREGYIISAYDNGIDALKNFKYNPCALAVIDLKMEPIDGIEILRRIKESNPETEVLMISAYGSVETAVKAMQLGAADFLTKPFSPDELRIRVKKIWDKYINEKKINDLIDQNNLLKDELYTGCDEIIGRSLKIRQVFNLIEQVADKDSTILVQGESGTGKELIAKAIHKKSKRSEFPFIKVNCGALNDNLLESELFGHEKGAFTGAVKQRKGRFELAHKGSLFLDEIGDVSAAMQVKLLRVLQEGEFERVGGEVTIGTNVRIIAATNYDLHKLIREGKFREDLFYRLSVIPVTIPPLRERKEDIPLLIDHFLNKFNHPAPKSVSPEGMKLFIDYSWPGNIRELENLIERLSVITSSEEIDIKSIAGHLGGNISLNNNFDGLPLEEALYKFEKTLIEDAMKKSGGVKNRAAKLLGIGTSVLYYKLEKYELL